MFLEKGALLNVKNQSGMTPLHLATRFSNNVSIVKRLLDKGALVNVRDKKEKTPLAYVARLNRNRYLAFGRERERADRLDKEKVTLLLENGACINRRIESY